MCRIIVCRRVTDFTNKVFFPKTWVQGFNFTRGHLLFQTTSVSRRTVPEAGLSLMKCFVNVVPCRDGSDDVGQSHLLCFAIPQINTVCCAQDVQGPCISP